MGEASKDALRVNFDRKLKLESHGVKVTRYVTFQLAEVLVSRSLFYELLERIHRLKPVPIEAG